MATARRLVLIVDDSPVALVLLEAVLKGEDYEVATAADAMKGFAEAKRIPPDLVVTDGLMPDVDGFELIRLLKEYPATSSIPVIMLTSGDTRDAEYQNRQPQPNAYVEKSMQMEPLLSRVRELLAAEPRKPINAT